MQHAIG